MGFEEGSVTRIASKGGKPYRQRLKCLVVCEKEDCQCARLLNNSVKASPGEDALGKYKSALETGHPYDLVILDTGPGEDGYETGKTIRSIENSQNLTPAKFIVVADDDNVIDAIIMFKFLQAVAFLPKPVTREQVADTVRNYGIGEVQLTATEYSILLKVITSAGRLKNKRTINGPVHSPMPRQVKSNAS